MAFALVVVGATLAEDEMEVEAPPIPSPMIKNDAAIVIGLFKNVPQILCQWLFLRTKDFDSALPLSLG